MRFAPLLLLVGPGLVAALLTVNPLVTAAVVLALAAIHVLLWRVGEPPVLWLAAQLQWLQGSMAVLYADALGEEMWTLSGARSPEEATLLSLSWTVTWAIGLRLAMGPSGRRASIVEESDSRLANILILYVLHGGVAATLGAGPMSGAAQLVLAFATLRWAIIYMIFSVGLRSREGRQIALLVFVFELIVGWLGFFSTFRLVVFVMFIAVAGRATRLTLRGAVGMVALAGIAVVLGVIWSTVKQDYREALAAGTATQSVRIDVDERAEVLQSLTEQVGEEEVAAGQEALISRIAYTEYFAHVLDIVPKLRPHLDGALWKAALLHVFTPRLLVPEKARLSSDSEFTERYTGLRFASSLGTGTSISVGLPAENYIEFGAPWMLVPALLLGLLYGGIYRMFLRRPGGLLGAAAAVSVLLATASIENGIVKTLGGLLTQTVVTAGLLWVASSTLRRFGIR